MMFVPHSDRLAFWKFTSAVTSFRVSKTCLHELKALAADEKDFRYGITCSFIVMYGRPFKQRAAVRLDVKAVPEKFLSLHKRLIDLRDKVFAHVDLDGPWPDSDYLNKSRVTVKSSGFSASLNYFTLTPSQMKVADELLDAVISDCMNGARKIWLRYRTGSRLKDGIFEVNTDKTSNDLLYRYKEAGEGLRL